MGPDHKSVLSVNKESLRVITPSDVSSYVLCIVAPSCCSVLSVNAEHS